MRADQTQSETAISLPFTLTTQQARNLHLAAQGLLRPPRARATRARVLSAIERMRLLQIDTINVVARSPYLVLFSRVGSYEMRWLDSLLASARIFECWAHEACFAPMQDYALHRDHLQLRAGHWAHRIATRMLKEHPDSVQRLLDFIRESGPVKASDFDRKEKAKAGWWGWKDEKRWLEALFATGQLMIARRESFQRVYDLTERVLKRAPLARQSPVSVEAVQEAYLLGAVKALGITQARWINDYFRSGYKIKDAALKKYTDSGELVCVQVKGWDCPAYVHRDNAELLRRAARGIRATYTTLLSPFDPVVWHRERASVMFDFDYTIECYTPAPKRRFGYYVLPILHRGRLIGRLDAKAHRADGVFEVKKLFLEHSVQVSDVLTADVASAIRRIADWHGTTTVKVRSADRTGLAKALRSVLSDK